MTKARLEAFSDGVIAILITIMVFDIKPPEGADWAALVAKTPVVLTYLISFLYLGIYWNNHHHMFTLVRKINGGVLWANLHLLFWLSLFPFATSWLRGSGFQSIPTAFYGAILLGSALSYMLLLLVLIRAQKPDAQLANAIGSDWKGKVSLLLYAIGVFLAFVAPSVSLVLYVLVALIWLVPDRRMESAFNGEQ